MLHGVKGHAVQAIFGSLVTQAQRVLQRSGMQIRPIGPHQNRLGAAQGTALLLFAISFVAAWIHWSDTLYLLLTHRTDTLGYYQFLPGFFLERDIYCLPWTHEITPSRLLSLFTIGVAILQLPFFIIGHVLAVLGGYVTDGYSAPYATAQLVGAAFYQGCSGYLLVRWLGRSIYPRVVGAAVLVLVLSTPLHYYTAYEPTMSHGYSFFLISALLYLVDLWVRQPSAWNTFLLFPLCTMVVLVRPLNGILLLIPFIYRASDLHSIRDRLLTLRRWTRATILGSLVSVLLIFPQSLYWHSITGKWVLFTYGVKEESFDFSAPHLFDVLFSHQNGWFVYSPLMIMVMTVLLWQAWRKESGARTSLVIWAIAWYFYGSWWAWWLGAAYGFRGFVEYSALFVPPTIQLLLWMSAVRIWWRYLCVTIVVGLIFINVRMSYIYQAPWDGPDWSWRKYVDKVQESFFVPGP